MKLAILTGGSKGLGQALTKQLTSQNWTVYELSRSGSGSGTQHIDCDLSDQDETHVISYDLFHKLSHSLWRQVMLINNAADIQPIKSVASLSSAEISKHITINQISGFSIISEFVKAFRKEDIKKTIVNISSGAAIKGYAGWSLYCASKAANENFINAIVAEEAFQNSPFDAINYNPGIMDTDMQSLIRNTDEDDFPTKQSFIKYKENGDLKSTKWVANHLIQLLSDKMVSGRRYSATD